MEKLWLIFGKIRKNLQMKIFQNYIKISTSKITSKLILGSQIVQNSREGVHEISLCTSKPMLEALEAILEDFEICENRPEIALDFQKRGKSPSRM